MLRIRAPCTNDSSTAQIGCFFSPISDWPITCEAQAVGINNAEGEMNVFSPSFRRAVATDLAEIKSSAPPSLWAGDDVRWA